VDHRRQVRADLLAVAAARRAQAIDLPHRLQRRDHLLRLTVGGERPLQGLIAEILRHGHAEDVLVPTRREVRRLSAVGARLEGVGRTDGKVDLFLVVPVHVAEPHVVRAVRVDVEAFVHRRHALT
jgi:hypothetical protein